MPRYTGSSLVPLLFSVLTTLKRINLEGNTHAQEINVSQFLYSYPYLKQQKPLFLPIIAYTLSSTKLEIRAK
jgi:hypothetical protein